jgi:hypothetical protein
MSVAPGGEVTNPPKVLLLTRLPSHAESAHEGESRARPVAILPDVVQQPGVSNADGQGGEELTRTDTVDFAAVNADGQGAEELTRTDTVDFAAVSAPDVHGAELARTETHLAEKVVERIHDL